MRFFFTMMLFFNAIYLFAQKPVIDSTAYKTWPSLSGLTISKDGKYVFYNINNGPLGSKTLVVQSTDGKWKKEFKGGLKDGNLGTLSNKYFFFINKNDSLGMLTLGTDQIQYIPNTSRCDLKETKGVEYLLYPSASNPKNLSLKNLKTNKERVFADVDSWNFEDDVLILVKSIQGSAQRQSINLADIATGKVSKIWEGYKPENLVLDVKHIQLAFKTGDSVWYYKFDSPNAICISDKRGSGREADLSLGYLDCFSEDGKLLFTSLNGKVEVVKPKNDVVEIWSYNDIQLQTQQENEVVYQRYVAVIDVENRRLVRLQQQEGGWCQFSKFEDDINKVALVQHLYMTGIPWSTAYKRSTDLVSLKNGSRKRLNFGGELSPCGKYIIYFDVMQQAYFSYEIATDKTLNLTKGINVSWIGIGRDDLPGASSSNRGLAAWMKDDKYVLVYDRYDIWKLDPSNKEKPVNLTNGYGRRNGIVFNLTFTENINRDSKLYLTAFSKENKNNGFFLKQLDKAGDPELLHMGPYLYQTNSSYVPNGSDFSPIKAKNADVYIVRRMSATDAPNYFSTKDFKTFTRLSDLQPQKMYNWYTTELHSWKSLDGRKLQGILYKPENFDPNKKYPVIFYYYERKSDGLNAFLKPDLLGEGSGTINIPTYVSNGYLVFSPDIYYKAGDPMQGTYDAVVSASEYVAKFPFVNSKKMGLQGNSFGALQTNYLVTHTNHLFAAAESSSGLADFVSSYGRLDGNSWDINQEMFEGGQPRMGTSVWENPGAYLKNSPIFQLDKITTPLLIMHTKKDTRCPFEDAIELFTGLRRLGKKSWMLVYSEGNHYVHGKEADDFSIRMMQFFDYYLKDKPAPIWMLDGVLAKDRSWKAGLELDTKGRTPGPGLLTAEEQQKVDSMMTRKPINITLK